MFRQQLDLYNALTMDKKLNNICNKFTNAWTFLLQPLVSKNQIQQKDP